MGIHELLPAKHLKNKTLHNQIQTKESTGQIVTCAFDGISIG
jgi:hypothetical protein